jgi:hypothetical protein
MRSPDVSGDLSERPLCIGPCRHCVQGESGCVYDWGGVCTLTEALRDAFEVEKKDE